jgi:hypothetical protein
MDTDKLWRVFNLTPDEQLAILHAQGDKCAVCQKPIQLGTAGTNTDHDHKTGLVRGLLCHLCNRALGLFRDNIELLRAAIAFLEAPPACRALGEERYGRLGRSTKKVRRHKRTELQSRWFVAQTKPTAEYVCGCKDYGANPLKTCPVHEQNRVP